MDPPSKMNGAVANGNGNIPSFEVEKETGKNDLIYKNMEGGVDEKRLAEADDDGRWPPRHGESDPRSSAGLSH